MLKPMFLLNEMLQNANQQAVDNAVGWVRWGVGNVLNVIRLVGTGLALIMLTWMSISYFTADGRGAPWGLETKADIKGKQLVNYAIGCVLFIGASNIIYFIAVFIADIFGATI